jgi:hypothetical protein
MAETPLYPGERLLMTKGANAVITLAEHGLDPKYDAVLKHIGFGGKEAIGGWLDLTTWRLAFRSHPLNHVTGRFSILLPTILSVEDKSGLITKKMRVTTRATEQEFVIWGISKLVRAIAEARAAIEPLTLHEMAREVEVAPDVLGNGLERGSGEILLSGPELSLGAATNLLDAANIVNLWEFISAVREADRRAGDEEPAAITKPEDRIP